MEKVDVKNLWIGDKVKMEDGEMAFFEGNIKDGKASVRKGKIKLEVNIESLYVYTEAEEVMEIIFHDEVKEKKIKSKPAKGKFQPEIDLHIEKLDAHYRNADAASILEIQLKACQNHIEHALETKAPRITIIHGKGEGKLRDYVHAMLNGYHQVRWKILVNKDGATEVWF